MLMDLLVQSAPPEFKVCPSLSYLPPLLSRTGHLVSSDVRGFPLPRS